MAAREANKAQGQPPQVKEQQEITQCHENEEKREGGGSIWHGRVAVAYA